MFFVGKGIFLSIVAICVCMIGKTWSLILPSMFLIWLGYALGGFFVVNYFIGSAGVLLGVYNLVKGVSA